MEERRPRKASSGKNRLESSIQKEILFWLLKHKVFAWYIKTTGTYDPKIKKFRKPPPYYRRGVPDIMGFIQGIPFVIEVKSATGRLSPDQVTFAADFKLHALEGIHIVARSLEDVERAFEEHGVHPDDPEFLQP